MAYLYANITPEALENSYKLIKNNDKVYNTVKDIFKKELQSYGTFSHFISKTKFLGVKRNLDDNYSYRIINCSL